MSIPQELLTQCWFLSGPTAGGKSAVAMTLARELNAEIVSMDSMAIYRGMDIGTAKPTADQQSQIDHHLIDIVDPCNEFSVSEYIAAAADAVAAIFGRGRVPLFVGGTGLYLRSVLRGVFNGPEANWELRRQFQTHAAEKGNAWLHTQLVDVDPDTANKLHPNDTRRIIRALEVFHMTGRPLSVQQNQRPLPVELRPRCIWLNPRREWLHHQIHRRVESMMAAGFLQEVKALIRSDPAPSRTAVQALGYRELIQHIEQALPLDEAVQQIKTGTRQFAKRQYTWFRNLEECSAFDVTPSDSTESVAYRLLESFA